MLKLVAESEANGKEIGYAIMDEQNNIKAFTKTILERLYAYGDLCGNPVEVLGITNNNGVLTFSKDYYINFNEEDDIDEDEDNWDDDEDENELDETDIDEDEDDGDWDYEDEEEEEPDEDEDEEADLISEEIDNYAFDNDLEVFNTLDDFKSVIDDSKKIDTPYDLVPDKVERYKKGMKIANLWATAENGGVTKQTGYTFYYNSRIRHEFLDINSDISPSTRHPLYVRPFQYNADEGGKRTLKTDVCLLPDWNTKEWERAKTDGDMSRVFADTTAYNSRYLDNRYTDSEDIDEEDSLQNTLDEYLYQDSSDDAMTQRRKRGYIRNYYRFVSRDIFNLALSADRNKEDEDITLKQIRNFFKQTGTKVEDYKYIGFIDTGYAGNNVCENPECRANLKDNAIHSTCKFPTVKPYARYKMEDKVTTKDGEPVVKKVRYIDPTTGKPVHLGTEVRRNYIDGSVCVFCGSKASINDDYAILCAVCGTPQFFSHGHYSRTDNTGKTKNKFRPTRWLHLAWNAKTTDTNTFFADTKMIDDEELQKILLNPNVIAAGSTYMPYVFGIDTKAMKKQKTEGKEALDVFLMIQKTSENDTKKMLNAYKYGYVQEYLNSLKLMNDIVTRIDPTLGDNSRWDKYALLNIVDITLPREIFRIFRTMYEKGNMAIPPSLVYYMRNFLIGWYDWRTMLPQMRIPETQKSNQRIRQDRLYRAWYNDGWSVSDRSTASNRVVNLVNDTLLQTLSLILDSYHGTNGYNAAKYIIDDLYLTFAIHQRDGYHTKVVNIIEKVMSDDDKEKFNVTAESIENTTRFNNVSYSGFNIDLIGMYLTRMFCYELLGIYSYDAVFNKEEGGGIRSLDSKDIPNSNDNPAKREVMYQEAFKAYIAEGANIKDGVEGRVRVDTINAVHTEDNTTFSADIPSKNNNARWLIKDFFNKSNMVTFAGTEYSVEYLNKLVEFCRLQKETLLRLYSVPENVSSKEYEILFDRVSKSFVLMDIDTIPEENKDKYGVVNEDLYRNLDYSLHFFSKYKDENIARAVANDDRCRRVIEDMIDNDTSVYYTSANMLNALLLKNLHRRYSYYLDSIDEVKKVKEYNKNILSMFSTSLIKGMTVEEWLNTYQQPIQEYIDEANPVTEVTVKNEILSLIVDTLNTVKIMITHDRAIEQAMQQQTAQQPEQQPETQEQAIGKITLTEDEAKAVKTNKDLVDLCRTLDLDNIDVSQLEFSYKGRDKDYIMNIVKDVLKKLDNKSITMAQFTNPRRFYFGLLVEAMTGVNVVEQITSSNKQNIQRKPRTDIDDAKVKELETYINSGYLTNQTLVDILKDIISNKGYTKNEEKYMDMAREKYEAMVNA